MGIQIQIIAGPDATSSSVAASGSIQHIITDTEVNTFGVNDSPLKNAVGKYFGKNPNDAFLHSPTPWNDLYKTYGWQQVTTVVVVQKAEILNIDSQPTIIATQSFKNNSTVKGTFNAGISQQVTNTVSDSWSTGGTLTIGQEIEYGIKFLGTGVTGTTSMSYSQSWEVASSHETAVTVGSTSGVTVELNPGESVNAQLTANKGSMKVRVTYQAYLIGNTAVNYNPTFKDHHFWCLDLPSVMAAGGIKNSFTYTEDLEIGYYSDSEVELKSPTGQRMALFSSNSVPGVAKNVAVEEPALN
jgi:hypothetical protein